MSCVAQSKTLSDALELSHAIEKLQINSGYSKFALGKRRFKDAKDMGPVTAYYMLSIADRILVTKCRVISIILENLDSLNYVLLEFNSKFSSDKLTDRLNWPATIILDSGRSFNPILDWREVATRKSLCNELSPLDDPYKLLTHTTVIPVLFAVNKRQLVVVEEN